MLKALCKKISLAMLVSLSLHLPSLADSPLTSTPFSEAYLDQPLIAEAKATQTLSPAMAAYLTDRSIPIDQRLALVNALGWNFDGQNNHLLFAAHLAELHGQKGASPAALPLTGEDLLLLGYLTAMDDYFHPELGLPMLRRGARQLWQSQSAQLVLAVTEAQAYLPRAKVWCQVWLMTQQALNKPEAKPDMRPAGRQILLDYMQIYADECQAPKTN